MTQFAKLFEIDGYQVLVRLHMNRKTNKTELVTTTWHNDSQIEITVGEFERNGNTANEAFELAGESGAKQFIELVKQLAI